MPFVPIPILHFLKRILLLLASAATVWSSLGILMPDAPAWPVASPDGNNSAFYYPVDLLPSLSGTFGELRNQHFHCGIDIRTGGQEGVPVRAAEDGFIARISVQPTSYGNCLHVKHPDGTYTVYAHLQSFAPGLVDRLRQEQLLTRQFLQEVQMGRNEFPVRKGDIIAWSGNSGASHGPHLHFEWRDEAGNVLNPLLHYADVFEDNIAPLVQEVAIEPIGTESRVQGAWEKWIIHPTGTGRWLEVPGIVQINGPVGFEYRGYDLMNGSGYSCGINRARLFLDGQLQLDMSLDRFPVEWRRSIHIHIDYDWFTRTGRRFERCYREQGNPLPFYDNSPGDGILWLDDTLTHDVVMELADMHSNTTKVHFRVKQNAVQQKTFTGYGPGGRAWAEVKRNTLAVNILDPSPAQAEGLYYRDQDGVARKWEPAFRSGKVLTWLMPLYEGNFPELVYDQSGRVRIPFHFVKEVAANQNVLVHLSEEASVFFPYGSLFQSLALQAERKPRTAGMASDSYKIGDDRVPLQGVFVVGFAPPPGSQHADNLVVCQRKGGNWSYAGNSRDQDGTLMASSQQFGEFCLMADNSSPVITPVNVREGVKVPSSQQSLAFRVSDQLSGLDLQEIYCTLDDEWVLFEYNPRTAQLYHLLETRPAPGKHILRIRIQDKAGNQTDKTFSVLF